MGTLTKQQKKVPELRFPEFGEDLSSKKILDTAPLQRGFDLTTSNVVDGDVPVVYSNGVLRSHNTKQVTGPGVVTGRSGTIGKVFYIEQDFWPHNTTLWVTDFHGNYPKYIYYLYTTLRLERYNAGSTVPTLNRNDVHSRYISVPSTKEQQKIADFLGFVDAWLDNLRQQKTALETYKRGMIQKLFTQQVRFKDDSGKNFPAWEQYKLVDISKITTGSSNREGSTDSGEYRLFDRSNDERWSSEYELDAEALIVAGEGLTFLPRYYKGKFALHQRAYAVINNNDRANWRFLFYFITYNHLWFRKMAVGSTMPSLRMDAFTKMDIGLPDRHEQDKIADFLTALDRTVIAKAEEITQVEQWKKGLMQKMFV